MAIFCCFDQLHRWNAWVTPPLGLATNLGLLWLIVYRTPKEMRIHSGILVQTCLVDLLLLTLGAFVHPVLSMQPDFTGVLIFHGYFAGLFQAMPQALLLLFSCWFILHTLDVTGLTIQFLYRYLVLNRQIRITFIRYLLLMLPVVAAICALGILWYSMARTGLNARPMDVEYFAKFMSAQSANDSIHITYVFEFTSQLPAYWSYTFNALNVLSFLMIIVCAVKIVRYVNAHTAFSSQTKDMNRQLTMNLIILATFPLFLFSASLAMSGFSYFVYDQTSRDLISLTYLSFGLITHWLPVVNPLSSIVTIRPYRRILFRGFIRKNNQTSPEHHFQQLSAKSVKSVVVKVKTAAAGAKY